MNKRAEFFTLIAIAAVALASIGLFFFVSSPTGAQVVEISIASPPPCVEICHVPDGQSSISICVADDAVPAHEAHGDIVGACAGARECQAKYSCPLPQGGTMTELVTCRSKTGPAVCCPSGNICIDDIDVKSCTQFIGSKIPGGEDCTRLRVPSCSGLSC